MERFAHIPRIDRTCIISTYKGLEEGYVVPNEYRKIIWETSRSHNIQDV